MIDIVNIGVTNLSIANKIEQTICIDLQDICDVGSCSQDLDLVDQDLHF